MFSRKIETFTTKNNFLQNKNKGPTVKKNIDRETPIVTKQKRDITNTEEVQRKKTQREKKKKYRYKKTIFERKPRPLRTTRRSLILTLYSFE